MNERAPGFIGGMAAGRPVLSSLIVAFAAAALAAVAFRRSDAAFAEAAFFTIAATALVVVAPVALASAAPKNFWLRVIYAALCAGLFLGARRVALQSGLSFGPFDLALALSAAAAPLFILTLGAPLWRSALALSLIGLAAVVLGAAGGFSIVGIEAARGAPPDSAGGVMALAAAAGAALAIQISAAFSRYFAEGGANADAAAAAARHAAAPAFFSLFVGVSAFAFIPLGAGAEFEAIAGSARLAAGPVAFTLAATIFLLPAALAMKGESEKTAVAENRRRAMLRPFLKLARNLLPPSSAIAASAIFLIIAAVAAFEARTTPGAGEIALVSAVAVIAAIAFVSLRTALMTALMFAAAGRIAAWGADLFAAAPPSETARIIAAAFAAIVYAQLFLAWRERRNPRRKTREVVQLALADSYFSAIAALIVGAAAIAASEAAGLWGEGVEAALYAGALGAIGVAAGPALLTAVGALFGRD
ncbi:MAG: hypothetical protein KDD85_05380 [Parvularculaceae bacterium]|nr:hypothetical protein [Parvularculaceae bacterium]